MLKGGTGSPAYFGSNNRHDGNRRVNSGNTCVATRRSDIGSLVSGSESLMIDRSGVVLTHSETVGRLKELHGGD